jgi:hypothetical protein
MARLPHPDTFADAPSSWAPLSDEAGSDAPAPSPRACWPDSFFAADEQPRACASPTTT